MQQYIRVLNGQVMEVFTPLPGNTINDHFTAEVCALFTPYSGEIAVGWMKKPDGTFVAPPRPAEQPIPTSEV